MKVFGKEIISNQMLAAMAPIWIFGGGFLLMWLYNAYISDISIGGFYKHAIVKEHIFQHERSGKSHYHDVFYSKAHLSDGSYILVESYEFNTKIGDTLNLYYNKKVKRYSWFPWKDTTVTLMEIDFKGKSLNVEGKQTKHIYK